MAIVGMINLLMGLVLAARLLQQRAPLYRWLKVLSTLVLAFSACRAKVLG
jgi:hypothetical protein